jgi:hypothetical protein
MLDREVVKVRERRVMVVAETLVIIDANSMSRQNAPFVERRRMNRCDGHGPIESGGTRKG